MAEKKRALPGKGKICTEDVFDGTREKIEKTSCSNDFGITSKNASNIKGKGWWTFWINVVYRYFIFITNFAYKINS